MPDKDNNFGSSLGLDFRKWWRNVQPKNNRTDSIKSLSDTTRISYFSKGCFRRSRRRIAPHEVTSKEKELSYSKGSSRQISNADVAFGANGFS